MQSRDQEKEHNNLMIFEMELDVDEESTNCTRLVDRKHYYPLIITLKDKDFEPMYMPQPKSSFFSPPHVSTEKNHFFLKTVNPFVMAWMMFIIIMNKTAMVNMEN
eukprot:Pgem_evm1s61